jgi:hypothetical protein
MAVPVPNRCPKIHEAIGALEAAHRDLSEASHNFCGHKRDAQEAITAALRQLRLAEDCDRCK